MTLAEFLTSRPPGSEEVVMVDPARHGGPHVRRAPALQLHCETCPGERWFAAWAEEFSVAERLVFLEYVCRNCREKSKVYALQVLAVNDPSLRRVQKIGETPPFGRPTPPRLLKLLDRDRELFHKGRRCEAQSLGIGAMAYYRRIVEDRWKALIEAMIKAATAIDAPPAVIARMEAATKQVQFSQAIDQLKDGIPERLMILNENPLALLHRAISRDLHNSTDDECLENAQHIEAVLTALAERFVELGTENAVLKEAVRKLSNST